MPSLAASDAATSSGLRVGVTIAGSYPPASNTLSQKGSKRQMRGSLSTRKREPANSCSRRETARSRNCPALGDSAHSLPNGNQSDQPNPAETKISSLKLAIASDSQ